MENRDNKEKRKDLFRIIVVIGIVIIIILLLWKRCDRNDGGSASQASSKKEMKIDSNQGAYEKEDDGTLESGKNITLPGWASITIPADTTNVKKGVDFFNPDNNEGWYYLTFELLADLEGNGEYKPLYQSDLVEPGKHIQKITLSEPVPAGTYKAKVFIMPYKIGDPDTPLNSGEVQVDLIAK